MEVIKARGERGSFLSRPHFIAEATSPVRSENKEQSTKNRSRSLQPIVNSKHLSFSRQKICCALSVQATSSVQTEVTFIDCERSHFAIMFFVCNI
jgi:hypothetical protein